jgi:hypothetical protein
MKRAFPSVFGVVADVDTPVSQPYSRGMALAQVSLGPMTVSRLAIGGNPFSGFSHQGPARDREMRRYYTAARIKMALRKAEAAGITTLFARADNHVMRLMEEYWDEGGTIQWFAQSASEQDDYLSNIDAAASRGAKGMYLHGGVVDHYFSRGEPGHFAKALERMRARGLAAGFAAHNPSPHEWIRDHLEPDFQLCCYYDPSPRDASPHHVTSDQELFDPAHRDAMARCIRTLKAPAVHYKVLAAGRTPVEEAFAYVARTIRPSDVVLVGFHLGDDENLISKTVEAFERIVPGGSSSAGAR